MTENGNATTRDQRFTTYLEHLNKLKDDRVTLREVLEREILLGFIRTNRSSINEFPLLDTQQQTVIELMCQRLDHPAYDYIHKLSGNFVALLGHYRKAVVNKDQELLHNTTRLLANTEVLLIKCMQGIVYSIGLITDNFEELVIRLFGQRAMDEFSDMLKTHQMGPAFWKAFMLRFVATPVALGHEQLLQAQQFVLSKEGRMLVVRYPYDAIAGQMQAATGKLEKTRIQKAFESTIRDYEVRRTLKLVHNALSKGLSFIPPELLSKGDVGSIARIACIDTAAKEFHDAYQTKLQRKGVENDEERVQLKFLMDQVTAIGVGSAIGVSITQQNLAAAMMGLAASTVEAFTAMGRNFRLANIRRFMHGLLEEHLILRLKEQAGDDLSKMQFMKSRIRRAPAAQVAGLGLSKIRLNKLFRTDPTDPAHLLFRPRSEDDLLALVKLLQLEPEMAQETTALWQLEDDKVEILLLLDLALVQRATTNLQARVQDILKNLGLVQAAPAPTPAPPPAPDAP